MPAAAALKVSRLQPLGLPGQVAVNVDAITEHERDARRPLCCVEALREQLGEGPCLDVELAVEFLRHLQVDCRCNVGCCQPFDVATISCMMPRSLKIVLALSIAALALAGYALAGGGPPGDQHGTTVTVTAPGTTAPTQTVTAPDATSSSSSSSSSGSTVIVVVTVPPATHERHVVVKVRRKVVRVRRYCTRQRHGWRCTPYRPWP